MAARPGGARRGRSWIAAWAPATGRQAAGSGEGVGGAGGGGGGGDVLGARQGVEQARGEGRGGPGAAVDAGGEVDPVGLGAAVAADGRAEIAAVVARCHRLPPARKRATWVRPSARRVAMAASAGLRPGAKRRPSAEPVWAATIPSAPWRLAAARIGARSGPRRAGVAACGFGGERGQRREVALTGGGRPGGGEVRDVGEVEVGGIGAASGAEEAADDVEFGEGWERRQRGAGAGGPEDGARVGVHQRVGGALDAVADAGEGRRVAGAAAPQRRRRRRRRPGATAVDAPAPPPGGIVARSVRDPRGGALAIAR